MPKLLFVQPTQYGPDNRLCKQKKIYLPGLAFPLLAAMAPDHWDIEAAIEVVDDIDFDSDADIIGIGTMGYAIYRGIEIAEAFRQRGKTVVMGGYMASMVASEALRHVDSVVVGDAEIAFPKMLEDFERHGRLKSLYHYPVQHLDGLPLPRYELLTEKPIGSMLPVQAGRGCPHTCSFCCIACLYQGKYLFRPVDEVMRDIQAIRELGYNQFYLLDDNIVSNPAYLETLCTEIEPLKMTWATQCSLHIAKKPALLEKARRAGATMMSFGVESITQEGLDKLGKSWLRVREHETLISRISKAGIMVSAEMMIGTDSDTEASIRATRHFLRRTKIPIPRFYMLTPPPGSSLFEQYQREKRLITDNLKEFDGSKCVFRPRHMSPQQLTALFWWLYSKVFSLKDILLRTLFNPFFLKRPGLALFAFGVNLHYRKYIRKRVVPNIL